MEPSWKSTSKAALRSVPVKVRQEASRTPPTSGSRRLPSASMAAIRNGSGYCGARNGLRTGALVSARPKARIRKAYTRSSVAASSFSAVSDASRKWPRNAGVSLSEIFAASFRAAWRTSGASATSRETMCRFRAASFVRQTPEGIPSAIPESAPVRHHAD